MQSLLKDIFSLSIFSLAFKINHTGCRQRSVLNSSDTVTVLRGFITQVKLAESAREQTITKRISALNKENIPLLCFGLEITAELDLSISCFCQYSLSPDLQLKMHQTEQLSNYQLLNENFLSSLVQ